MRVALYCRVSTEEQARHGLSLDDQKNALIEYAKTNGMSVVGIYEDAGISARKPYKKRPAILRLLEDVRAKKIDIILFTKLDRWFRNVGNYYAVQEILDAHNVSWRAILEDYETVTASGRAVTLTLKEFDLLRALMEKPGTVFTRDRLLSEVWGTDYDGETRTVDVHIRTLRQKLGESGSMIGTVRGVGYRLEAEV